MTTSQDREPLNLDAMTEQAHNLLSLAGRDQIYQPARTVALLARHVVVLAAELAAMREREQRVRALADRFEGRPAMHGPSYLIRAALAGEPTAEQSQPERSEA